jgi:metal-responsive CopG/Arc/MetJ family transcriptional regulator
MKPIQVMFDETLLRRLDADAEVKKRGRSAVLRRAAAEYLGRSRRKRISEAYRAAYKAQAGLGEEFSGWEEEGSWPGR